MSRASMNRMGFFMAVILIGLFGALLFGCGETKTDSEPVHAMRMESLVCPDSFPADSFVVNQACMMNRLYVYDFDKGYWYDSSAAHWEQANRLQSPRVGFIFTHGLGRYTFDSLDVYADRKINVNDLTVIVKYLFWPR